MTKRECSKSAKKVGKSPSIERQMEVLIEKEEEYKMMLQKVNQIGRDEKESL